MATSSRVYHLKTKDSSLWTQNLLSKEKADELLAIFTDPEFPLEVEPQVIVFGKKCKCRRRVGFFSDVSAGYPFAGQVAESLPLTTHPVLGELLDLVNRTFKTEFNGILVNHYRDGTDNIGFHSDDEKTLDNGMVVAVSAGASRNLVIKTKGMVTVKKIETNHGQVLAMDGNFQKHFKHGIPAQKKIKGARVSFTFRCHLPGAH